MMDTRRTSSALSLMALMLVVTSVTVGGQRSSPQFSFPPPGSLATPFGADVFGSGAHLGNHDGLGLLQQQQQQTQQQAPQQSSLGTFNSQPDVGSIGQPQLLASQVAPPPAQQHVPSQPQAQFVDLSQTQKPQQTSSTQLARPSLSLSSFPVSNQAVAVAVQQNSQPSPSSLSSSSAPLTSVGPALASFRAQSQQAPQAQAPPTQATSGLQQSVTSARHQQQQQQHHQPATQAAVPNASQVSSSLASTQPIVPASRPNNKPRPRVTAQSGPSQQQQQHAREVPSHQNSYDAARKAEATAASLAAASAGGASAYRCPDSFGFFRHHKSCDKYWACENNTVTLKLCGNGLMFDDSDPRRENCAYPFSVECGSDRTDLEPPISTPHCPRLYGLFPDQGNCRVFYSCWNGESSRYECPPGLAYDKEQHVCVWADHVDRCEQSEVSDGFVCPDATEVDQPGHYTRHAHPTDCRKFYVCIEGVARPYGCSLGTVFNVDSLQCDEPENVSGCEKYYGELDPKQTKKLARENAGQSQAPAQTSTGSGSSSSSSTSGSRAVSSH